MEPQKVPEKLVNPIDYRLILIIFGVAATFQIYLYSLQEIENAESSINVLSTINPLVASIMAFIVARRYGKSEVFGKAYFALALGMLMNFLGEVTYGIYDSLGIESYPSVADVFFYAFYPLTFYHLSKNIRFFKPKIKISTKILIVSIPIAIIVTYSALSYEKIGEANSDFYFGLFYVIGSSIVFATAILGAIIFRQGILGTAWLVLSIGISLTTLGDSWFSYLETFDQYNLVHPVNLLWYTGYWVITYALYKHKDSI